MKIIEVTKSMTWYVETDAEDFPHYRTSDERGMNWENLMGESWEPVYTPEKELQELFHEYMKKGGT
jgi:hypothetical protein